ncbi:putative GTP-binding protein EngB [Endomicrobiia bacterium]|nr:putative GTP-binding protein EngB [Endomicrobiia bacterium]GHT64638.1 putative GTP-binding protein EngB [Endomicrobiia bacterium]GHT69839.1 putative GTP-binding protein EngB [Endomicrobiia bacterium]GHT74693.1 putative GTP-binding protein EngB [Endomicrobiia bacterium]
MLEKTVFFRATSQANSLPKSVAEIVLSGRSNVGKSSVINALCLQKNLARISKTPGRTRSINVYSVAMRKWIIDLPGYGFARISLQEKKLWNRMIEECIVQRKSKKVVYIIIDAFVGPTELDFDMAHWLDDYGVMFKIVANKFDKMPSGVTEAEVKIKAAECFDIDESDVFTVSAKKRNGFDKLQVDIVKFLDR